MSGVSGRAEQEQPGTRRRDKSWYAQIRVTPTAFEQGADHVLSCFYQEVEALRRELDAEISMRELM